MESSSWSKYEGAIAGIDYPAPPADWQEFNTIVPATEREKAWEAFERRPISRAEAQALREIKTSQGRSKMDPRAAPADELLCMDPTLASQFSSDYSWSTSGETRDCFFVLSAIDQFSTNVSAPTMGIQSRQPLVGCTFETSSAGTGNASMASFSRGNSHRKSLRKAESEPQSLTPEQNVGQIPPQLSGHSCRSEASDGEARRGRVEEPQNAHRAGAEGAQPLEKISAESAPHSPLSDCDGETSNATPSKPTTPCSEIFLEQYSQRTQNTPSDVPADVPRADGIAHLSTLGVGASAFQLRGEADADDVLRAMLRLSKSIDGNNGVPTKSREHRETFVTRTNERLARTGTAKKLPSAGSTRRTRAGALSRGHTPAINIACRGQLASSVKVDSGETKILDVSGRQLSSERGMAARTSAERSAVAVDSNAVPTYREGFSKSAPQRQSNRKAVDKRFPLLQSHSAPGLVGPAGRSSAGSASDNMSSFGVTPTTSSSHTVSSVACRSNAGRHAVLASDASSQVISELRPRAGRGSPSHSGATGSRNGQRQQRQKPAQSATRSPPMAVDEKSRADGLPNDSQSKRKESRSSSIQRSNPVGQEPTVLPAESDATIHLAQSSDSDDKTTGGGISVILETVTRSAATSTLAVGPPPPSSKVAEQAQSNGVGPRVGVSLAESRPATTAGKTKCDTSEEHGGDLASVDVNAAGSGGREKRNGTMSTLLTDTAKQHQPEDEVGASVKAGDVTTVIGELVSPAKTAVRTAQAGKKTKGGSRDSKEAAGVPVKDREKHNTTPWSPGSASASDKHSSKSDPRRPIQTDKKQARNAHSGSTRTSSGSPNSQGSILSHGTRASLSGSSGTSRSSQRQRGGKIRGKSGGRGDQISRGSQASSDRRRTRGELPRLFYAKTPTGPAQEMQVPVSAAAEAKDTGAEDLDRGGGSGELPAVAPGTVDRRSKSGGAAKQVNGNDVLEMKVHSRPVRVESKDLETTTEALTNHHLTVDELLQVLSVSWRGKADYGRPVVATGTLQPSKFSRRFDLHCVGTTACARTRRLFRVKMRGPQELSFFCACFCHSGRSGVSPRPRRQRCRYEMAEGEESQAKITPDTKSSEYSGVV